MAYGLNASSCNPLMAIVKGTFGITSAELQLYVDLVLFSDVKVHSRISLSQKTAHVSLNNNI